jgi:phosphoglycolate phosphatase-like HAD superfamily hydrolase
MEAESHTAKKRNRELHGGQPVIYIFDLDGTIADASHRLCYIHQTPPDWAAFFSKVGYDEPIWPVISIARALHESGGHKIIMSTGRPEDTRVVSSNWLRKYRVPYTSLYMRTTGDHREDNVVKSELLDRILADNPTLTIGGVFEDRQQVVDMYRERGIKVFQVAKGDF